MPAFESLDGATLLYDGPPTRSRQLAVTKAILHTNPRIEAAGALLLAGATAQAARANALPVEFLAATLLQESAYDPRAVSSAGAIGIAQFMPATAAANGVDPTDPLDAIRGAAALLASYVDAYRRSSAQPYALALAAYNAGPGAVARYGGIPPYPQTQQYVALITDRWAQIASYEASAAPVQKPPR